MTAQLCNTCNCFILYPSLTPCSPKPLITFFWQCLERACGDTARLQDAVATKLEQSDHCSAPSKSCLVCSDDLEHPVLFDCAHAVCFSCISGMLQANPKCMYALPCPCAPVNGCTGKFAFLQTTTVDPSASKEAVEEWQHYRTSIENAVLRTAGIYPCPSLACAKKDFVLFVPAARLSRDSDIECGSCGLHICTQCTHTAGKCVPFHAPMPCTRRVELDDRVSRLQAAMLQLDEDERAADRAAAEVSLGALCALQMDRVSVLRVHVYSRLTCACV